MEKKFQHLPMMLVYFILDYLANAYLSICFATIFAMACIDPMGKIRKGDLEPEIQQKLQGIPDDQVIEFFKGQ